ncbi:MAG TPA: DUF58 domain-containing protein [Gemmataceae bacterium]|nr:DUF58 domain-containing protein [Gemmataceae bacterium]
MKWFLGALLLLLAALLLESSLLAYAMYVLLALLLLSRWLARSWIGSLSATRTCKQLTADIGARVPVVLTVTNNGGLPVPWLLAEDLLPQYSLGKRHPRIKIKGKRLQIAMLRAGATLEMKYQIECLMRGYFQIGPLTLESGDLFGLHRRFRVLTEPVFLLVYPRIVPLLGYDIASRRPIGDVRLTHRLYEDPTRIAGVRPYEAGDPLNRVHWRATARTGALHSKVHEPSTLSGATVLLDFHQAGYHQQGEPFRSELAVTTAVSLANAVYEMGQQIGLATNGRDAVDRIKTEGWEHDPRTRQAARSTAAMRENNERLQPQLVETRRGVEQLLRIRETLARVELTDGLTFTELVSETIGRLPRDATILAVLPEVSVETAISLGNLRRAGLAVSVVLILLDDAPLERAYGRLVAEGIRDIRHLKSEEELPELCRRQVDRSSPYTYIVS